MMKGKKKVIGVMVKEGDKMGVRFGSYRVIIDKKLSELFGIKEGSELKPSEFVKAFWGYVKMNNLSKK